MINLRILICFLFSLFISQLALAQHEIKIDYLSLSIKGKYYGFSYEYLFDNFGLEVDLYINGQEIFIRDSLSNLTPITGKEFNQFSTRLNISSKFYLLKNRIGHKGFFVGPTVGFDRLHTVDDGVADYLQTVQNPVQISDYRYERGNNAFGIGGQIGFKFVIKKRVILAIDTQLDKVWGDYRDPNVGRAVDLYWFANIKIGYGFGKIKRYTKRKKENKLSTN